MTQIAVSRRFRLGALLFLAGVLLLCGSLLPWSGVSAHAKFVRGNPGPDDVLSSAPAQIDAYFAEDIVKQKGTYGLSVTDSSGNQMDNQDTVLDDNDRRHLTVTLQSGLGAGAYTVKWWTVSDEDGDTGDGSYTFTITGS